MCTGPVFLGTVQNRAISVEGLCGPMSRLSRPSHPSCASMDKSPNLYLRTIDCDSPYLLGIFRRHKQGM